MGPEWPKYRLEDLFEDKTLRTVTPSLKVKKKNYSPYGGTPIISQEKKLVSGYCDRTDSRLTDGEYICFGDHSECIKYVNFPFVQGADGLKIFRLNNDKISLRFLYYALLNSYVPIKGGYQRHFKYFKDTEICLPPISLQQKISDVLSFIDDKINLNTTINDTLERMAYDEYMHVFFGRPANGTFDDIIKENPKSSVQVESAKAATGKVPFFTSGNAILEWQESLVTGRNCYLNSGGNADIKFYVGAAAYSTDTWCISGKGDMADFLYLTLVAIKPELDRKFFAGTGLKHLQKPLLKEMKVYIPSTEELSDFNSRVKPAFDTVSSNTRENLQLAKLRDWLLPMLLNGQATVE